MSRVTKTLVQVLRGVSDANIAFEDICHLLEALGFSSRISGDHHIYHKTGIIEIINIQPKGAMAKPYQVAQVRALILKYRLGSDL